MERELPQIALKGTVFLVDASNGLLVEQANKQNALAISNMSVLDDGYGFWYDTQRRSFSKEGSQGENSVWVTVKWLTELDPDAMAAKYGKLPEAVLGKSDYEVIVDQEVVRKRMEGVLPILDIDGNTYVVDTEQRAFRPTVDIPVIRFSDNDYYADKVRIAYDQVGRQPKILDFREIVEFPKDTIAVEFPGIKSLDPIGFYGKDCAYLKDYLMETPPKLEYRAKVIPWEETDVPRLIERNKKWKLDEGKKGKGRGMGR
ncbi:MAG: hypothetical protein P0Y53_01220 [Candidatus Pseudobacter hemicellulosilyticus]|uniref:Uncharacterized protein n=1 Tax=Candidatus Pseudobacter hemicellulosilyticus TaxID=3121375 RepID=A0AAJ6BGE4_9BACT|nr:MAG: hypothetical protein P0Y53_01220 [Pseudobacter sp.]